MLPLIALALLTPQSASQVEWRTLEIPGGQAVRYGLLAARDRPKDEPRPLLVALAPVLSGDIGLQASMAAPWLPGAAESGWLIAGVGLAEPIGATVARIDAVTQALGREFVVEGRPHLWAAADHSLDAFGVARTSPGRFASALIVDVVPREEELAEAAGWLDTRIAAVFNRPDILQAWRDRTRLVADSGDWLTEDASAPFATPGEWILDAMGRARAPETARWKAESDARATLDLFHAAAAKADGATYFDLLAADAVYLGTDAAERWTKDQFRTFAEPYFASGRGWTYVATERHVQVSRGGDLAWFDERLENDKYGETRGSGVLRRSGGRWRIVQYNLAFPVPNELSLDLVARIRASKAPRGK
jgi:ketosteroid isomerase-like protein